MDFRALKARAVFQISGDAEEAAELAPYVGQYVNEGVARLATSFGRDAPALESDADTPALPDWCHPAIADFASWMLARNGDANRQARGLHYRAAFEEAVARANREGGEAGKRTKFVGIYP